MLKNTTVFFIVFSLGFLTSSCNSSQNTAISFATPSFQTTATSTLAPEYDGLITTLGETVKSPWWIAIPAFSPDGKMVTLVSEKVRIWNTETQKIIYELEKPYSNCYTENVVFSSDGKLLATSIYCITDTESTGHVLIWNTESGVLLHDWEQKFSKNTSKIDGVLNTHPATGIAFLPKSSVLAFANGNTIEIKDVLGEGKTAVLELGDEMVATNISISRNGKRLFAFMDFSYWKLPHDIGQKYALQTWDLESYKQVKQMDIPEPDNIGSFYGHFDVEIKLTGTNLIKTDYINKTFTITDIETGNSRDLYYLGDVKVFISQNTNYISYLPNLFDCKNQGIKLWDTYRNQSLHVFHDSEANFVTEFCHGQSEIIFNSDNTILAIAHEERLSLWDISSFTKPKESTIP